MRRKFAHPKLGEEIRALAGSYTPQEELRIPFRGREVLCITGTCCIDCSCCAVGGSWSYLKVVGYIISWKSEQSSDGRPVSEIETVESEEERRELCDLLSSLYPGVAVEFE